ncbi:Uncharacterised protein [Vibrio cholerae]|nr:Uncharacterised protein [Vibrio cholerae]CSI65771.1 Uncharacterised protein [Vibrio cholerae]
MPTRKKVRTPNCANSSTAIDVEGPPIPVEHTTTDCPSSSARYTVYSRWLARKTGLSISSAIFCTRAGSPGIIASVAPFKSASVTPRWNTVLVIGGSFNCVYSAHLSFRVRSYFTR